MTTRRFVNGLSIARRVMRLVPVGWEPYDRTSMDALRMAEVYNAIWGDTWELRDRVIERVEG